MSRWNRNCDLRMYKLYDYLAGTVEHVQEAFCGDKADQLHLLLYCDASFADCIRTNKSTSGLYIALAGPNTFIPIAAICKKQTCVSHSSTESEVVAMELGLRSEALPILTLWDLVIDVMDNSRNKTNYNNVASAKQLFSRSSNKQVGTIKSHSSPAIGSGGNKHPNPFGYVRGGDCEIPQVRQ